MRFFSNYVKSVFIGFTFVPVFFVVISVLSYLFHYYLIFAGKPIAIRDVALWLLLLDPRTSGSREFLSVVIAWVMGWLLVWSRSRNFLSVIIAEVTTYFLYIIYLVSFWRIPIILVFPDDFYQLLIAIASVSVAEVIRRVRPKKTIFDRLSKYGIVFPDEWKRPVDIPLSCPHCGAKIYSSSDYCWRCGGKIFGGDTR